MFSFVFVCFVVLSAQTVMWALRFVNSFCGPVIVSLRLSALVEISFRNVMVRVLYRGPDA